MARRIISLLFAVPLIAAPAYLVFIALQIRQQSRVDEAQRADVIIVLGAAEYRGTPSPVFKARLDHAYELHKRGLAPRILTTGGAGGDPIFTEGGVGRAYLVGLNVPSESIIVEPEGETTFQSTTAAAEIMRRMGLTSCIVVRDGYHIFRAKRMLEFQGLVVYGSPRTSPDREELHQWGLYFRQAVAYLLWKIGVGI